MQRDDAPRRISRPYSASGTEGLSPGYPNPDPTAPTRFDYLHDALRPSKPPGHITDRNAHRIPPFRASASARSRTRFPGPKAFTLFPVSPTSEDSDDTSQPQGVAPRERSSPAAGYYPVGRPMLSWACAPPALLSPSVEDPVESTFMPLGSLTAAAGKPPQTTRHCPTEGSDCLSRGLRRSWGF